MNETAAIENANSTAASAGAPSAVITSAGTLIRHSDEKVSVSDARGRVIEVRRLHALQVFHLTKVMGANATNPAVMDMAVLASSVSRINTLDIAFPLKERDVDFLIQQLDFDGLEAAGKGLVQLSGKTGDEGVEAAKN